ncbi:MAG: putative glycoside hydrolase [bacterium]|nr:putative glycoside hydrolase [bacterium]
MPTLKTKQWKYVAGIIALVIFTFVGTAHALTDSEKFPRTGNYYLRSGTDITPETVLQLARYDLLVLPAEAQIQNPTLFGELRTRNPDIVIVAYVPTLSFNNQFWTDSLHQNLLSGIEDDWWLRDPLGNRVSVWPGTTALNVTSGWSTYLPDFVHANIMATGLWDGIFYDEVDACITCRNAGFVDIDRNGQTDSSAIADAAWRSAYSRLFARSRFLEGTGTIIIINGSSTPEYRPSINGRMFESFPTPWEGAGRWEDTMQNYKMIEETVGAEAPINFIAGDSNNTGNQNDFRDVRFGLTSTLLGGGYFGYDYGTENHGQTWWYDEYDAFLGRTIGNPRDLLRTENAALTPSVWRQDFDQGIVVVNATNTPQTVSLREDFEKLHGTQDPFTNDGSIISRLSLPASDGVILLRINEHILGASFPNGAFSRIFNKDGQVTRTGFFTFDNRAYGGETILLIDIELNGTTEAITATRGRISVWNEDGSRRTVFAPYGDGYLGAIHLATGDINGDGFPEIITGAGRGGGPHVRIFTTSGRALGPGFFAFDKAFRGGVSVAAADLDGDSKAEIITGAGPGGGPHVRTFRSDGSALATFFAYDSRFLGGVFVAAGDIDGDGKAEIITGAGPGGGPHVRTFSGTGQSLGKGFFPYDPARRGGVHVGAIDLDGNGILEILAFTDLP